MCSTSRDLGCAVRSISRRQSPQCLFPLVSPRYQTPFGHAMRREIAFPTAEVSAGRSGCAPTRGHPVRGKRSFTRRGVPTRSLGTGGKAQKSGIYSVAEGVLQPAGSSLQGCCAAEAGGFEGKAGSFGVKTGDGEGEAGGFGVKAGDFEVRAGDCEGEAGSSGVKAGGFEVQAGDGEGEAGGSGAKAGGFEDWSGGGGEDFRGK